MRCTIQDCTNEAEVIPIITVPCNGHVDSDKEGLFECTYEKEFLVAQEICRECQSKTQTKFNYNFPEFTTLVINSMRAEGHEPYLEKTYINWVSVKSEQYQMYMKLKEAYVASNLFSNESAKQVLH